MKNIILLILFVAVVFFCVQLSLEPAAKIEKTNIFEKMSGIKHHSATVTELEDGALLAVWYFGYTNNAEADKNGALYASIYKERWSEPFVIFDTPNKAEGNSVIFYNPIKKNLYLFAGVMQSEENDWSKLETHWLTANICKADDIQLPIAWTRDKILSKDYRWTKDQSKAVQGFVLRNKPIIVEDRMLLPLYTHTKDRSGIAVMDMELKSELWRSFRFVKGAGDAEQPSITTAENGLLMYCRNTSEDDDKAPFSKSIDAGITWAELSRHPYVTNENSSLDLLTLPNKNLLLVCNPFKRRNKLALCLSEDNGNSWKHIWLENELFGEFSYPSMILSRDNKTVHIVYTYNRDTIMHAKIEFKEIQELFNKERK